MNKATKHLLFHCVGCAPIHNRRFHDNNVDEQRE
jgi:hypothetical protein